MLSIRLTAPYDDLKEFLTRLDTVCSQQIWFEHRKTDSVDSPSRTHVHGLVEGVSVSVETLRNWLKWESKTAPSQYRWTADTWSFKTGYKTPFGKKDCDANFITYMSKGDLSPVHIKGFDDWKVYRSNWIEPVRRQTTLPNKKNPDIAHDKQITQWEMLEQIKVIMSTINEPTNEDLIKTIFQVHKIHHKLISRYKVRDFYDSYYSHKNPDEFARQILNLCQKT